MSGKLTKNDTVCVDALSDTDYIVGIEYGNKAMTKVRIENKVTLARSDVAEILRANYLASGSVHLDQSSQARRSHLKLHRDSKGYFVRSGARGSCKEYLGSCKITYLDGKATLFQFTFKSVDDFNADQDRRWCKRHGIRA